MMGRIRLQHVFRVSFMGMILGVTGSCIDGGSGATHGGETPGLTAERPIVRNGFVPVTPVQATEHETYSAPAENAPLAMAPNPAYTPAMNGNPAVGEEFIAAPSVTLGTIGEDDDDNTGTPEVTNDRVYFNPPGSDAERPTSIGVDVGNDPEEDDLPTGNALRPELPKEGLGGIGRRTRTLAPFARPAGTGNTNILGVSGGRDRRLTLGEDENNEDPRWRYTSRALSRDADFGDCVTTDSGGNCTARNETFELDDVGDVVIHVTDFSLESDDGGYLGGGWWRRLYAGPGHTASTPNILEAVGMFIQGTNLTGATAVTAATGSATYRGHTYGRYTALPVPVSTTTGTAERSVGWFAAKATLTAEFAAGAAGGTIEGSLTNFLFNTNLFDESGLSVLEEAIGGPDGMRINLESTSIVGDRFAGTTRSAGLTVGGTTSELVLMGQWSGIFYGTPAAGGVPWLLGAIWGASGQMGDPGGTGFSLSLIGSLGTRWDRVMDIPTGTTFAGTVDDDHSQFFTAAKNGLLFAEGVPGTVSSVTQGAIAASGVTNDRVFVSTFGGSGPTEVTIKVGNLGDTTADLVSAAPTTDVAGRRTTTLGDDTAGNPAWGYTTQTVVRDQGGDGTEQTGDFDANIVNWNSETDNYVTGGVWERFVSTGVHVHGAFVDGEDPTETTEVRDTTGTATYRGHSFGNYSTSRAIDATDHTGWFAAKAVLSVDFGSATQYGTLSGEISNFIFSKDKVFTAGAMVSDLEAAIGGPGRLIVYLRNTPISNTQNSFNGVAESNGIRHGTDRLDLTGQYGGRFFGTPDFAGNAPQVIAGTWGASDIGSVGTDPLSLALIGTFGASIANGVFDRFIDVPLAFGQGTTRAFANYRAFRSGGSSNALFATGDVANATVTMGSRLTAGTTTDRVFLAGIASAPTATSLTIDVGNTPGVTSDNLVSDAMTPTTNADAKTAATDRRINNGLGTLGNTGTDPEWNYTTRTFTKGTTPFAANDEFSVNTVDWTDAGGTNYMAGGVWSYNYEDPDDATATLTAYGAFVDGEDPSTTTEVTNATGDATYRGHSYGHYALSNTVASGDANPGRFAAQVKLDADFDGNTISGTVSNFLFSEDDTFATGNAVSRLDSVIGGPTGLLVTLDTTTITLATNQFSAQQRRVASGSAMPMVIVLTPEGGGAGASTAHRRATLTRMRLVASGAWLGRFPPML